MVEGIGRKKILKIDFEIEILGNNFGIFKIRIYDGFICKFYNRVKGISMNKIS